MSRNAIAFRVHRSPLSSGTGGGWGSDAEGDGQGSFHYGHFHGDGYGDGPSGMSGNGGMIVTMVMTESINPYV